MFCKHKNRLHIGKRYRDEVFYCPDCGKYYVLNKFMNISFYTKTIPIGMMIDLKNFCEKITHADTGCVSDGYHTFNDLYEERAYLFATIVSIVKDKAWKTKCHENGDNCFGGGWFLVTIETPNGNYGYHYEMKYWDLFDCDEIEKAKPFDGYSDKNRDRLLSIKQHDKDKWHDIRENPNDLPNDRSRVLVCYKFWDTKNSYKVATFSQTEYDKCFYPDGNSRIEMKYVLAWKEIEPFGKENK